MLVWVLYDIKENKPRQKVFSLCKNFGLYPIQKSVFLGIIDEDRQSLFFQKIKTFVTKDDSIIIMQTTKNKVKELEILGKPIDTELALREKKIMFF